MNWTKPYYGVQHLGECNGGKRWCTVSDLGTCATLIRWHDGARLSSAVESTHDNAELARNTGERWLSELTHP